ncbi:MAG: septum formation initiator family protein [Fimbriimonadales bacterium]
MDRKLRKRNRKLATLSIVVIAVGVAAYATRDDWTALSGQRQSAADAEARRQQAEQKYADLAEERARLETPAGQERRARELGYRKSGEQPLNVR